MEVKIEPPPELVNNICCLCLSTDRRTTAVDRYAFKRITDCEPSAASGACFECRAFLARVLRFQVQAIQANQLLDAAASDASRLTGECMSALACSTKNTYDAYYEYEDYEYDSTLITDIEYEVDIKDEPDEDVASLCEVWAEAMPQRNNTPEVQPESETANVEVQINEKSTPAKEPVKVTDSTVNEHTVTEVKLLKSETVKETHSKKALKKEKAIAVDPSAVEKLEVTDEQLSEYRNKQWNGIIKAKYTCKTCVQLFTCDADLKKHKKDHHSEQASHECDICLCRFDTIELLREHRGGHYTLYRCMWSGCDYFNPNSRVTVAHHAMHKANWYAEIERDSFRFRAVSKVFECDYCGRKCAPRDRMLRHIKWHQLQKNVMCEICGYQCRTKGLLNMHMLAHVGPSFRKFECEICQRRFKDKYRMKTHKRTHTGERPYKCDICSATFTIKEQLTQHIKERHTGVEARVKKQMGPRTKSFFVNEYPESSRPVLKRYADNFTKDAESNKFKCNNCNKLLAGNSRRVHYNSHIAQVVKCEKCDKSYKSQLHLEMHIRKIHATGKAHECNLCRSNFPLRASLLEHMKSHSSVRPFKCNKCNLMFKGQSALWRHNQMHKDVKPHQCDTCGKKFSQKANLKCHIRVHTKEKPYECAVCGKKFVSKRGCMHHSRLHATEVQHLPASSDFTSV